MKRLLRTSLAFLMALLMIFQAGEPLVAWAADEVDKAVNPTGRIQLTVPDRFLDGGNWFFIPEPAYNVSEKSTEKLYIPIQRTGDLDTETQVTLKVTDLTSHHDVNYAVEIYKETVDPYIIFDDVSVVDIIVNADGVEEVELGDSENDLGELIYEAGGAELVDGQGNTVATVTANRLDENGNPIAENAPAVPGPVENGGRTVGGKPLSATESLMAARNAFTGTTSDRQELAGSKDLGDLASKFMSEDEFNETMAGAVAEDYPGKEFRLTFAPGEKAKFLVITPLYSPAGEGDSILMLMLKNPGKGYSIGEDVNPVNILITDEDEPEDVTVSMAADTVVAQDGKAVITVNRTGRINALKGVTIATWGGSAKEGDEYSGVGAKLYFSMGPPPVP